MQPSLTGKHHTLGVATSHQCQHFPSNNPAWLESTHGMPPGWATR